MDASYDSLLRFILVRWMRCDDTATNFTTFTHKKECPKDLIAGVEVMVGHVFRIDDETLPKKSCFKYWRKVAGKINEEERNPSSRKERHLASWKVLWAVDGKCIIYISNYFPLYCSYTTIIVNETPTCQWCSINQPPFNNSKILASLPL